MKRLWTTALVVTLAQSVLAAGAVAAPRCEPIRGRNLLANRHAEVYRDTTDARIYGCSRTTGKRYVLGAVYQPQQSSSGGGGVTHVRLAGRFAAVVIVNEDEAGRLAWISVVDLVKRREVYGFQAGGGLDPAASDADITDLEVAPNGSVAFIEGIGGPAAFRPPKRLIVRRHDSRGSAVLDDSSDIAPSSLQLRAGKLTWRLGEQTRHASLR